MLSPIVDHTIVNLIGKNENVLFDTDSGELFEFGSGEDFSDGIVRRVDDDAFCLGGESGTMFREGLINSGGGLSEGNRESASTRCGSEETR